MKKTILLLVAGMCFVGAALAQEDGISHAAVNPAYIDYKSVRFGVFVAPNISWMHPTASQSADGNYKVQGNGGRMGFTYGLMAEYYFAENYGIATGIQVNATGGKVLSTAVDMSAAKDKVITANFDYRLQYLEIPVALKLRTDMISGFRFFGQAGITLGINLARKATYGVDYYGDDSTLQNVTVSDKVKIQGSLTTIAPIILQMNIGGGLEYPISHKLSGYVGIFFNNGFLPDATSPEHIDNAKMGYKGSFDDGNVRLNNFSLRLGLFF